MGRRDIALRLALGIGLVLGCARYRPEPLDPARHPAELRARRLDDPALAAQVAPYAGSPVGSRWTDRQLAVAALAWRSEVERARAEWRAAVAGVTTAGGRPQPGAEAGVERRVGGRRDGAPWVVSLGALTTVELGGKRGARLLSARARATAAESRLAATGWDVAQQARAAAAALAGAVADSIDAAAELAALHRVAALERERYAEAALATSELARTGAEVQDARAALADAARAVLAARAALAGALAVPAAAVEAVSPEPVRSTGCAALDSTGADSLVTLAVGHRATVTTVLADYAAAEAALRLEVARQRPDLEIGPGFIWDQGVHRWTLALALPALLGFRNRGPIREAEAARSVAALRVAETQDSVIAQVESAAQACRGARLALAAADSQAVAAAAIVARARAAYERGETVTLEPARAELQFTRAEHIRRTAGRHLMLAGIALEAAAGAWRDDTSRPWPDPRLEPGEETNLP